MSREAGCGVGEVRQGRPEEGGLARVFEHIVRR